MSWMDSASGSSSWHGGGGNAGNNGTSGAGTGGMGGGGSNNSGSRTGGLGGGLSTGNTTYGNTAFGRSGGMAQGYATAKLGGGAGMGPTINTYSNFRTLAGNPMFSGAAQNIAVRAPNANVAAAALAQMQQAAARRIGGLLSDEDVTVGPVDPVLMVDPPVIVPTASFNPYDALTAYDAPYGPEYFSGAGQVGLGRFSTALSQMHQYSGIGRGYPTNLQNQSTSQPTAYVRTNVLGGGGMPGVGMVPSAARWSNDGLRTYGGYGNTGYTHSLTGITN